MAIYFLGRVALMIWCVKRQLRYGCPNNRMDSSCTRCQRLCECGDNWLQANISGFHIAQILCQSNILSLDFPLQNISDNFKQNYICLFFIVVLNKRWNLRRDQISNQQSVTGFCHWLVHLSQTCFALHAESRHYSPIVSSTTSLVSTPSSACEKFLY